MKSIILTTALLLCGITSGYAQLSEKEYETVLVKLHAQDRKLGNIDAGKHRLRLRELEEVLYINRLDSTLTTDEEKILREKIAIENDSLEMITKRRSILSQQSDSLTLLWVRGVLTSEEISGFVKRLLETDDNNRSRFWSKEEKAMNSQDSLLRISNPAQFMLRKKAFRNLYMVYSPIKKVHLIREYLNVVEPSK
jgi:hypothetical protein